MRDLKLYWNSIAETKEFTTPMRSDLFARHVKRNAEILDLGCGYGRIMHELSELGYSRLRGIDFSEGLIRRGRRLYPDLKLEVQQSRQIDFPDSSFDAVLLCAVLTCIPRDADQEFLRDEIFRVLRPGGILYVNDFLLNTDPRNRKRYEEALPKYGTYGVFELPEGAVLRHHAPEQVHQFFEPFERLEFETTVYRTMNGHTSNGYCFLGRKSPSPAS